MKVHIDSDLIEGKGYIRDTLAYEGDFTSYKFDGEGTFYNHKGEEVYTGPFTAGAPSDQDAFIAATRDIHYDDYAKDMDTYRADPVRFKGEIIQLWEDDGSGVRNYVVSLDDSNEQLLFIYDYRMRLGLDVELQESDIITGYGLTTAAFTYDSKSGTSVTSPAVFTYFVEKNRICYQVIGRIRKNKTKIIIGNASGKACTPPRFLIQRLYGICMCRQELQKRRG